MGAMQGVNPCPLYYINKRGENWLVFLYLLIIFSLTSLILYLVPKREKIGGWLYNMIRLSDKGQDKKEKKN